MVGKIWTSLFRARADRGLHHRYPLGWNTLPKLEYVLGFYHFLWMLMHLASRDFFDLRSTGWELSARRILNQGLAGFEPAGNHSFLNTL